MRKLILLIILAVLFAPKVSISETTTGGHVWCLTEELRDELLTAVGNGNISHFKWMINNHKCVVLRDGLRAAVISSSWTGTVKARIVLDDTNLILWGPREGLR